MNDDCCCENLSLIADTSISAGQRCARTGCPDQIYGNCSELTNNAILKWENDINVAWHYIDPGKPQQNGYIESFPGPQLRGFGFH